MCSLSSTTHLMTKNLCLFVLAICLSLLARMDKGLGLSLPTSMTCIRWSCYLLPLLGKMPSQQGIFPKRSYSWKPKIDSFPPTTKPHPLNLLIMGPPLLYWLGTSGWCFGPCVLVLVSFAFGFFHPYVVSTIPAMSHSAVSLLLVLIFHDTKGMSLHYFFLFPHGLAYWLGISFYPTNSLDFCHPFLFLQT